MRVYLVRNIETKGILGVFWAKTTDDLMDAIDETTDPDAYEYVIVRKPGGIVFDEEESPLLHNGSPRRRTSKKVKSSRGQMQQPASFLTTISIISRTINGGR